MTLIASYKRVGYDTNMDKNLNCVGNAFLRIFLVFIGYYNNASGYLCLNPENNKVVSRDVALIENNFELNTKITKNHNFSQ